MFIPPLLGVQLEAAVVDGAPWVARWCSWRRSSWQRVWLDTWYFLPLLFDCLSNFLRLGFDPATGRSSTPDGVSIRPRPGFDSAMHLLPRNGAPVYAFLADALRQLGWREDQGELLAHLYDWRQAPPDWAAPGGAWEELKGQLEDSLGASGNKAVVVCLSMGCNYFNAFLGQAGQEWAGQHVERLVALSGVWGGSPDATLALLSGRYAGLSMKQFRELIRHIPAASWLLPEPAVFGGRAIVANTALQRSFNASDVAGLLRLAGAAQAADVWEAVRRYTALHPPGVPVVCLYGTQVQSPAFFTYSSAAFEGSVDIKHADGDGTAPLESLQVCVGWARQQAAPVVARGFPGVLHSEILVNPEAFAATLEAIVDGAGGGGGPAA